MIKLFGTAAMLLIGIALITSASLAHARGSASTGDLVKGCTEGQCLVAGGGDGAGNTGGGKGRSA
jgi:hypothetical protein